MSARIESETVRKPMHWAWLLVVLLQGSATIGGRAGSDDQTVRRDATVRAVERILPSVVNISTATVVERQDPYQRFWSEFFGYRWSRPETTYSRGSGVIIDESGFVLTNEHVVRGADRVWVNLSDQQEPLEAEVVDLKRDTDLALLRIRPEEPRSFTAAAFARSDDLILGETVLALGNPFGLGGSVSRGILSSKSRRPTPLDEAMNIEDWLQTDAAINPGNSGGPLINLNGEVIGINVAVLQGGQGIGFAIPVKLVLETLSEIFTPELASVWFGATVSPEGPPLLVHSVQLESPAYLAGLRPGDEVVRVNGEAPKSFIEFNQKLIATGTDEPVRIDIRRGESDRTITVRQIPEGAFFSASLIRQKTGLRVSEMDTRTASQLGLSPSEGLLVTGVEDDSPASAARLRDRVILRALDGHRTSTIVEAAKILHRKQTGDEILIEFLAPRITGRFLRHIPYATVLRIR